MTKWDTLTVVGRTEDGAASTVELVRTSREGSGDGHGKALPVARAVPIVLEVGRDGATREVVQGYSQLTADTGSIVGRADLDLGDWGHLLVRDMWSAQPDGAVLLRRCLEAGPGWTGGSVRLECRLEFREHGAGTFSSLRYLGPSAIYDKNDLDQDGVEDYTGATTVVVREDRLTNRAFMAYDDGRRYGLVVRRRDRPGLDLGIESFELGQPVLSDTDIGSLGVEEWSSDGTTAVGFSLCYPFAERSHSFAVQLDGTPGWRSLRPLPPGGTWQFEHELSGVHADRFVDAGWAMIQRVATELSPRPVGLRAPAEAICRLRLGALERYYMEGRMRSGAPYAGVPLNCHPQDGAQLANIIQIGFTGQTVLTAYGFLRGGAAWGDQTLAEKGRKIAGFIADSAVLGDGMLWNLYNVDDDRLQSWWTGLILPLAYAKDEEEVRQLMGTLADHLRPVTAVLEKVDGTYLRCMAEEYDALLMCYQADRDTGRDAPNWLAASKAFGEFLLRTQDVDGGWFRAYDAGENPMTDPSMWFGANEVEQKCSTATAVGFLVRLAGITGDRRYIDAATAAGDFVARRLLDPVLWSGGVHDSIDAKGMKVDNEAILFCMEAMESLWQSTGDDRWRRQAHDAARMCASWIFQWDVPLPPRSTLAGYGFRSTGLGACDTCSAGYVHPFELRCVPTLVEIGLRENDGLLVDLAELCFGGCNQTVALEPGDWGYAGAGLQEEGYFVSWWMVKDPMFAGTDFGGRYKGEGNKTCLPWVNAIGAFSYLELVRRFGTADIALLRAKQGLASTLGGGEP